MTQPQLSHTESAAAPIDAGIPPTLSSAGALGFWAAVLLTGIGAGIGAAVLTKLLEWVQHVAWPGTDRHVRLDRCGAHQ